MLELKPACERCGRALPPGTTEARICSFECTFCTACADGALGGRCPNCAGELVRRPVRKGARPTAETGAAVGVDRADGRRFADAWVAAWNAHELDVILAHYAPDVEYASPFVARLTGEPTGTLRGAAALRPYFAAALAKYPDLHFRLRTVAAGVGSVVLVYDSVEGLLAAEAFEFDAAGRVARVRCHYVSLGAGELHPPARSADPAKGG